MNRLGQGIGLIDDDAYDIGSDEDVIGGGKIEK